MTNQKLRLMRNTRVRETDKAEEYMRKILDARKRGNFIYAGQVINEARNKGMKLNHLAVMTEISTPTLSNWSMINKRATHEMKVWAAEGKIGIKALREIVRLPKQYQIPLAEKIISKEITTNIIDRLVQRLKLPGINITDEIKVILATKDNRKMNKAKHKKSIPDKGILEYKYTRQDVVSRIDYLVESMASFDSRHLGQWEKIELRSKIKILLRMANTISEKIGADGTVSKM